MRQQEILTAGTSIWLDDLSRSKLTGSDPHSLPHAPGMTTTHYAPLAVVRLNAIDITEDEAAIDFGGQLTRFQRNSLWMRDLSPSQSLIEAAANLFTFLREADKSGAIKIAVAPIPIFGLGEAINDRLMRASAQK